MTKVFPALENGCSKLLLSFRTICALSYDSGGLPRVSM